MTESNLDVSNVSEKEEDITGTSDSVGANHDIKDKVQANHDGEDNQTDCHNAEVEDFNGLEKKSYKGKHLSETERTNLVNLIKTLDKEELLKGDGNLQRAPETSAKRMALWNKIVPAFNEICGTNCDISKLKRTLIRIKQTPQWKSHSLLFDLGE